MAESLPGERRSWNRVEKNRMSFSETDLARKTQSKNGLIITMRNYWKLPFEGQRHAIDLLKLDCDQAETDRSAKWYVAQVQISPRWSLKLRRENIMINVILERYDNSSLTKQIPLDHPFVPFPAWNQSRPEKASESSVTKYEKEGIAELSPLEQRSELQQFVETSRIWGDEVDEDRRGAFHETKIQGKEPARYSTLLPPQIHQSQSRPYHTNRKRPIAPSQRVPLVLEEADSGDDDDDDDDSIFSQHNRSGGTPPSTPPGSFALPHNIDERRNAEVRERRYHPPNFKRRIFALHIR